MGCLNQRFSMWIHMVDEQFILTFLCQDRPGIVAATIVALLQGAAIIVDAQQAYSAALGHRT